MGFVYKLTLKKESRKAYIGQTIRDIHERLKEHQLPSSGCRAIYNAIQKHGWENFDKEWYEVPDEDLNFYEEMLVALLGTLAPGGYNLMEGGGNGRPSEETKEKLREANLGEKNPMFGKEHTEETKEKMSEAQIGKEHTEETKEKLREANLGEKNPMFGKEHTEETKQKMSEAHVGKTLSEETKQKISEAMSGKMLSEKTKQKISEALSGEKNHNSKKVYQYNLDGTYVDEYASCGEAARALEKSSGSLISMCAHGKRPSAYGFKWSYTEL
ncbi:GIY-YIG catalytic domain-containing endonuclease [Paramecium bursaria Chlorella virus NW665.2]|nr:GIY-YIG catalytic domain-containing endonuclease [Paramecium bursaria Chlorella virus NW665.2]